MISEEYHNCDPITGSERMLSINNRDRVLTV